MLTVLALAFQLQLVAGTPRSAGDDSLRDIGRAHDAQAGFERGRRYVLPWSLGGGGRCDVRVGRFCWWYEGAESAHPAEPAAVAERRAELLRELDALGERHPADRWISGMRVYYRLEDGHPASADSVARECRAEAWWCSALRASAAHARGDLAVADSGFAAALAAMPDSTRCAWRDISSLLPGDARARYEHLACQERLPVEARYWMLATPRLSAGANEWRSEFYARRLAATLLASAVTPHRLSWGRDAEELVLRYGLPVAWSRIVPAGLSTLEPEILGHDPSPSFHFGPRQALLDSGAVARDDGWALDDLHGESRYAHRAIRRLAGVAVQLARFRRGDSTLAAAAWATADDSLAAPAVSIGVLGADGRARARRLDSARVGRGSFTVPGVPRLVGVELGDSASGTFARSRALFAERRDSGAIALSDLLVYRPADAEAPTLAQALALAIPGDTASVSQPIGLYWEAYGSDSAGAQVETSIIVERTDHGFFRAARQRLGLADPDSPVRVRWNEARPAADGVMPRALSLDLSTLPAGRYRITLAITSARGAAAAEREVELRQP
ncbi:MAG: hypothetical protein JWN79_1636 [Gemmatimonadetes bacterium]|nr:hypothetical protein [Gemmatimonadota bacterium]